MNDATWEFYKWFADYTPIFAEGGFVQGDMKRSFLAGFEQGRKAGYLRGREDGIHDSE